MHATKPARASTSALSRRTVLAAAASGAAGMAAARLLALRDSRPPVAPGAVKDAARGAGLDWVSPLDRDAAKTAQLLRRATFGATPAELEQTIADGYARTVDRLVDDLPLRVGVDRIANDLRHGEHADHHWNQTDPAQ